MGRPLTVEIGQLAKQANGAALIRYGDSVVLSTATASKEPKNLDFFPLTVSYEEKLYPSANNGRIGRSIKRLVKTAFSLGLPSRLINPPGILPTAYSFSS